MDSIVDEVVVTGTRVAARTRLDSLAPVDVLAQEALDLAGHHRARRSAGDRRALAEFSAAGDHRRHGPHPPRHAARPRARSDTGAGEQQAPPSSRRWSTSTVRWAAARPRWISMRFRWRPSNPSKCCAMAPPRNTARMPSPASSICACATRVKAATPPSPTANTTPTSKPNAASATKRRRDLTARAGSACRSATKASSRCRASIATAIPPAAATSTIACRARP